MTITIKNTLFLANAVQVALFKEAILPQIINEGGRWNLVKPTKHAEAMVGLKVVVGKEGDIQGFNFNALKKNYNVNDSNWVNDKSVTPVLLAIASKAAKKEVSKKELYFQLESIKEIMKASAEVLEVIEVPEVEEMMGPFLPEESTILEEVKESIAA